MFPVPAHLPRSGGEHISSPAQEDIPAPADSASEQESAVLTLLKPLLDAPIDTSKSTAPAASGPEKNKKGARWTAEEIRKVRESLEKAVEENKAKTHRLVLDNLPTISHDIQLSSSLRTDMSQVKAKLESLEKEIDITDPATSFLPPLVTVLNNHFSSLSTLHTSRAYISALKSLQTKAQSVSKLEQAIWSGETAESWVIKALSSEQDVKEWSEALEIKETKVVKALDQRKRELYDEAVQQFLGGWAELVTVAKRGEGVVVTAKSEVKLPAPRGARPNNLQMTPAPHYSQTAVLQALNSLGLLSQSLQTLQTQLLEDVIIPITASRCTLNVTSSEGETVLRVEPSASTVGEEQVLQSVRSFLSNLSPTLIPSSIELPETSSFLLSTKTITLQALLDNFLLPLLPSSPSALPAWISLLQTALTIESSLPISDDQKQGPISRFFQSQAALEYATKRRYDSAELVRGLVLRGWKGWEGVRWEREREVVGVEEVEVSDDEEVEDAERTPVVEKKVPVRVGDEGLEEEDGWGFDEPVSVPEKNEEIAEEAGEDDGWGFDEPIAPTAPVSEPEPEPETLPTPATEPTPIEVPKPTKAPREAKRLGKKAAKKPKEHDPWDPVPDLAPTPSEVSEASSSRSETPVSASTSVSGQEINGNGVVHAEKEPKPKAKAPREAKKLGKKVGKQVKKEYDPWDVEAPVAAAVPAPASVSDAVSSPALTDEVEGGWGWEDDAHVVAPVPVPEIREDVTASPKKRKRTALKEERKVIKEVYQVSKGCEELLIIARRLLKEVDELKSTKLDSPSFENASTYTTIHQAIAEVFTLYRALLPTYYSQQLLEVPSLALQAYNDTNFLSFSLPSLSSSADSPESSWDFEREQDALLALGDHLLEAFITNQLGQIDTELEGVKRLEGTGDDVVFRDSEKCIKGLVFELESLSRVIKPVVPQSERYPLLGTLLTHFTSRLSSFVLSLSDITEIESNRLTELVRLVYPLENLFAGGEGVVGHVRGWLKFCYIAEILQANLVDITYLLDQNALVDFTPDELIGLVRALFASSEKRDRVIDRIEAEGTGVGGEQEHEDERS
ncbi:hypothetical protein L198_07786 [Cryptococcus wingfieldii CBS 7118]|uniref:ZW10 C-terminal helical domain-containing protein n=1 Tax=Cryptococcus wingfieldii CBS 7118 TaxID=1295528 RepID=A0A1E3HY86_9TREE|nr:hypothetical protein L198_07786 [Cryptococcus wingfieldii CBS 7118]ODN81300.1 hypothetical protein L198_07786 [Cryptococcus wingfieldii CBS 7118]